MKRENKYSRVVIELSESKRHHEVVGWRFADEKDYQRLRKRTGNEGGQFLITKDPALTTQGAADLSALESGSETNIASSSEKSSRDTSSAGKTWFRCGNNRRRLHLSGTEH